MLGYGTGRFGYLSINLIELIEDLKTASKNTRLPILLVPNPTYQNPGEGRKTKQSGTVIKFDNPMTSQHGGNS